MRNYRFIYFFLFSLFLFGCGASAPVNFVYWPQSLLQGQGKIKVNEFTYMGPGGDVKKQNVIKAALAEYELRENMGKIVSRAILLEFKFAGYTIQAGDTVLDGEITELEEISEGTTSKWHLTINYILSNSESSEKLFNKTITIETPANRYNNLASFNTTVRSSFDKLVSDPEFVRLVSKSK